MLTEDCRDWWKACAGVGVALLWAGGAAAQPRVAAPVVVEQMLTDSRTLQAELVGFGRTGPEHADGQGLGSVVLVFNIPASKWGFNRCGVSGPTENPPGGVGAFLINRVTGEALLVTFRTQEISWGPEGGVAFVARGVARGEDDNDT